MNFSNGIRIIRTLVPLLLLHTHVHLLLVSLQFSWLLDSRLTDHITGNKSFLYFRLFTFSYHAHLGHPSLSRCTNLFYVCASHWVCVV